VVSSVRFARCLGLDYQISRIGWPWTGKRGRAGGRDGCAPVL